MSNKVKNGMLFNITEAYKAKDKKHLTQTKELLNKPELSSQIIEAHKKMIEKSSFLNDYFK